MIVAGKRIVPLPVRAGPVVILPVAWPVPPARVVITSAPPAEAGKAGRVSQQDGQDLADGGFPGAALGQRQVGLDLVAVAAAVFCFTT